MDPECDERFNYNCILRTMKITTLTEHRKIFQIFQSYC